MLLQKSNPFFQQPYQNQNSIRLFSRFFIGKSLISHLYVQKKFVCFVTGWIFLFQKDLLIHCCFFCLARLYDISCECKGKEKYKRKLLDRAVNQFLVLIQRIRMVIKVTKFVEYPGKKSHRPRKAQVFAKMIKKFQKLFNGQFTETDSFLFFFSFNPVQLHQSLPNSIAI